MVSTTDKPLLTAQSIDRSAVKRLIVFTHSILRKGDLVYGTAGCSRSQETLLYNKKMSIECYKREHQGLEL